MELPDPPLPPQIWAATPCAPQALIVALQQRIRELERRTLGLICLERIACLLAMKQRQPVDDVRVPAAVSSPIDGTIAARRGICLSPP